MNILRLLFPGLLILISQAAVGSDSVAVVVPSIRAGFDVSGFARQLVEPEIFRAEATVDVEWRKDHFAVLEAGMASVDIEKETHRYQAKGYFFRLGPDLNILGRTADNPNDLILVSLRYGFGTLQHEAPFLIIYDPFWGDHHDQVNPERFRAHWAEAGIGLRTELWNNVFIGWGLRGRLLLSHTGDTVMEPYYIGGFGKSNGSSTLMVHYHIMYRLPLR